MPTGGFDITEGMEVVAADGSPIGPIREVRGGTLIVDRGSQPGLSVPLDAVRDVTDDRVTLSVPADQVLSQGWEAPASTATRVTQHGAAGQQGAVDETSTTGEGPQDLERLVESGDVADVAREVRKHGTAAFGDALAEGELEELHEAEEREAKPSPERERFRSDVEDEI